MYQNYVPILLFVLIGLLAGIVPVILGLILGPQRPSVAKLSAYECGFPAFTDSRTKFDVRFYLVAILFIIFDLEIAFLFPWGVIIHSISAIGFWAMMIFLAVLTVGFIYEWQSGALEWE